MTLLDHYVRAVRLYLPRKTRRTDILAELTDHLQSKLEERAEFLGRRLTDLEQQDVLAAHGNPVEVAARYGSTRLGFVFGAPIISPGIFPAYLVGLGVSFGATLGVNALAALFGTTARTAPASLALILLAEFVTITIVFAVLDASWRRELERSPVPRRYVSFPPPYLQAIPRVQSVSGLIVLSVTMVWWAALPFNPALLLGSAARTLQLTSAWRAFYWPILGLLAAGVAQRTVTIARPDWAGLQFFTRLCTNGLMVSMTYPILHSYPYVSVAGTAADLAAANLLAGKVNSLIWSQVLTTGGLSWLFWTAWHAWLCSAWLRVFLRASVRHPSARGL